MTTQITTDTSPTPAMPGGAVPKTPILALNTPELARPRVSEWQRARRSLWRARWPLVAILILVFMAFLALFGPQVAPRDPNRQALIQRLKPPLSVDQRTGQMLYPLGTDALGRDVLSRLIYGARISLTVGFVAVMIGGTLGTLLGVVAGYFGKTIDDIIMRLADIQLAFPFILLTIMVLVVLGPGFLNLVLVLGVAQWVTYARIARGQVIAQREREYVEAARAIGASNWRIMFRSILPNIIAPLIVVASFNVASVILSEASLSFLGLGVPITIPTWGGMLAESRDSLLGGTWWLAVLPGVCIMLTVISLNILGDWLRDFLDPRLRGNEK
jgi:peptide/nickel transport system permease protein